MKKFLAILVSIMLVLSLSVFALAAASDNVITIDNAVNGETYTAYKIFDVTYSGTGEGGTPAAAPNPDQTHLHSAYTYTITNTDEWWSDIIGSETADANGVYTAHDLTFKPTSPTGTYIVEPTANFDPADFAAFLNGVSKTGKTVADSDVAASGTATLEVGNSGDGYYFVDTSLGSVCSLDTTEPNATIREKNSTTTQNKTVKEDSTSTYGDKNDADFGQTVEYKTEIVIGKNQSNVVFHDIMQSQLALDTSSIAVYTDAECTTPLSSSNYTVYTAEGSTIPADAKYTGDTFAIAFDNTYTEALTADTTLYVVYTATLTPNAIVGDQASLAMDAGNDNKSSVTYGDSQRTTWDWTRTYTWDFDVYKYTGEIAAASTEYATLEDYADAEAATAAGFARNTDTEDVENDGAHYWVKTTAASNGTPLANASFQLSKGATVLEFVEVSTNVYRLATADDAAADKITTITTDGTGRFTLQGLDADTYTLTETAAPDGYNMLKDPVTVVIDSNTDTAQGTDGSSQSATMTLTQDGTTVDEVRIQNQSGSELPSTGGIGTTIFYIVGAVLVLGAAIILIAKRRSAVAEA